MNRILGLVFIFCCGGAQATDLKITNCLFDGNPFNADNRTLTATLTVSWNNSWRTDRNYDAAWIFFKVNNPEETRTQRHGFVKKDGHRLVLNYLPNSASPAIWVPEDQAGIMIYPDKKYRGDVKWRIKVELDVAKFQDLNLSANVFASAFSIEMVHVPEGSYFLGDVNPFAQTSAAFYKFGSSDFFEVKSEEQINVSANAGNLFYNNQSDVQYKGDAEGPVPTEFPKGYNGFYVMKYELTQGNYVSFLNSIGQYYTHNRANFGGRNYAKDRGSIRFENGKYETDNPQRPASFLSWDDDCAFSDWAALRPMTELEFEKAARGNRKPTSGEFPWGTTSRDKKSRYYDNENNLVFEPGLSEKELNDTNLDVFGASFYWVMDLNGSMWERCVTIGNPRGRTFKGSHGDGRLAGYTGNATNEDWPNGFDGKGGISYRGGGNYQTGMAGTPMGEVSSRPYGAWGDGPRDIAYGFRAVRSLK